MEIIRIPNEEVWELLTKCNIYNIKSNQKHFIRLKYKQMVLNYATHKTHISLPLR